MSAKMFAASRGRPKKSVLTADAMLSQLAVLNLTEFCSILGMDTSTALRKEREGLIQKRRELAGKLVFITAEVREWMHSAPIVQGPHPDRSRKSRQIA